MANWFGSRDVHLVAIDADDTIWEDAAYFRALRSCLLDSCSCKTQEDRDQALAILDSAVASTPPGEAGYADAVRDTAKQLGLTDFKDLEKAIHEFLNHPVEVFPHVRECLALMSRYRCILLTKGSPSEQQRKLEQSGLTPFFSEVLVVEKKSKAIMQSLLADRGVRGESAIIIGNSIRHDILPAIENGARAIWVDQPNNFFGRNAEIPEGVCVVQGWNAIHSALLIVSERD